MRYQGGLWSCMTSVLMKRGDVDTDVHTGRTAFKHAGKDQGDTSGSQAKDAKDGRKAPEGMGKAWNRFPFTALRRNPPCQHPELRPLASGTMRE